MTTTDLSDLNVIFAERGCFDIFERLFGVKGRISEVGEKNVKKGATFSRLWIWTHHVYCGNRKDNKRKGVVDYGQELGLSGFSLPGKPGFIAVEGETDVCYEYWKNLKSWGWKQIELRYEENNLTDHCFDGKMQELHFLNATATRNNCIDYGRFRAFLEEKRLGKVFELLFKGEFKQTQTTEEHNFEI